jgi:hypothetical protein
MTWTASPCTRESGKMESAMVLERYIFKYPAVL